MSSNYLDDIDMEFLEAKRLVEASAGPDPAVGLAAVAALRGLVEVLETLQVEHARSRGWSWRDIATVTGVTQQAVHSKHARRASGAGAVRRRCGTG